MMFHLGRRNLFSTSNFLAFDQVDLYLVQGGGQVTGDDISTSKHQPTDGVTDTTTTTTTATTPSATSEYPHSGSTEIDKTTTTSTTTSTASTRSKSDDSTSEEPQFSSKSTEPQTIPTATTPKGDITTVTKPPNTEQSYYCDFDGPLVTSSSMCGGVILEKGNSTGRSGIVKELHLDETPYFVTDYGSIGRDLVTGSTFIIFEL